MNPDDEVEPFSFGTSDSPATPTAVADGLEASEEHGRGWEMVAVGASAYDDCSIFPPSLHEGLDVRPDSLPATLALPHPLPDQEGVDQEPPSCPTSHDAERVLNTTRCRPLSDCAWRLVGSGIDAIHAKFALCWRGGGLGAVPRGYWSFAATAGIVGTLIFMRRRHRREKQLLLLLLQEKNQVNSSYLKAHLLII